MSHHIRFLADANFDYTILTSLRRIQPNIECFTSENEGTDLRGIPDPEVLALASRIGCILLTHDVRTMPQHFGDFLAAGNTSPGVLLVTQLAPISQIVEDLLLIWEASTPDDWIDQINRIPWK